MGETLLLPAFFATAAEAGAVGAAGAGAAGAAGAGAAGLGTLGGAALTAGSIGAGALASSLLAPGVPKSQPVTPMSDPFSTEASALERKKAGNRRGRSATKFYDDEDDAMPTYVNTLLGE